MPSTLSESDRRKTLRQVVVGLAIVCLIAVSAAIRQETVNADADTARRRMCFAPSTNTLEGDISPDNLKYLSTAKKETDDKEKYTTFLKHALPILQEQAVDIKPDFYVTFSVYFDSRQGGFKQFAAAVICKKRFGSEDNECRNRSYFSYSYNEPEILADIIVDDILKSEPIIRKCPNA